MSESDRNARFFNYPAPKAHEQPWVNPPPAKNPVVKGALLNYLSTLVTIVPGVPRILWSNAGFGELRTVKGLDGIDFRLDPTVVPIQQPGEEVPKSHTNISTLPRALPKGGNPRFYTIEDFHNAYKTGAFTPSDVAEALLPLARRDIKPRSPHSTSFTESRVDLVTKAAEASTLRWKEGKPLGILDGVPFAVKDDVDVQGYKRYFGTSHDYTLGKGSAETSWCVKKLEEEGAVLIGKLNMHELGSDTTNNNPTWGTPLNPYNHSYYTGGSSGGVASVVGHGIVPFGIGSDGGGSIRIPSNYCGLYGLKPSHGRVSIAPLDSGESVVVRGPIASNMADLEVAFRVLAQPDPTLFPSSHFAPPKPLTAPREKILGVFRPWLERADKPVLDACNAALSYFQTTLGYKVIDITIPFIGEGQTAHAMTILAEGVDIHRPVRSLTPPNRILMCVAKETPSTDYLLAQRVRHAIMQHLAHLFQTYPGLVIVTPTTPNAGWAIDKADLAHGMTDGNMTIRSMEYVWLANFTGVPCIQFPVGYVDVKKGEGRLPVGLSGHGEWGSEDALIEFGFDGERYLFEGVEGGWLRPEGWIDVLEKKEGKVDTV